MKIVFASTVGTGVVSKIDVFTPPIVPFRGDVEFEPVGDFSPAFVVNAEYDDEADALAVFFSPPDVEVEEVLSLFALYEPFCA